MNKIKLQNQIEKASNKISTTFISGQGGTKAVVRKLIFQMSTVQMLIVKMSKVQMLIARKLIV